MNLNSNSYLCTQKHINHFHKTETTWLQREIVKKKKKTVIIGNTIPALLAKDIPSEAKKLGHGIPKQHN